MPQGYERFDVIPGRGGSTATSFGFGSYTAASAMPCMPYGRPIVEYYYP